MLWRLLTVINALRGWGCTLCDSLYSQVRGDQTAKLVQEMKTNDAHAAQFSFSQRLQNQTS